MLFGLIADKNIISAVNLNTLSVGVATIPLCLFYILQKSYMSLVLFSILFAIGMAGMNSLTTMYLCELVGLKRFSNATGIINLFRGFGCFIGPFASGYLGDQFGITKCFVFSSVCFLIGFSLTLVVSFKSIIMGYLNRNKNDTTIEAKQAAHNSEISKNLLNNRS